MDGQTEDKVRPSEAQFYRKFGEEEEEEKKEEKAYIGIKNWRVLNKQQKALRFILFFYIATIILLHTYE